MLFHCALRTMRICSFHAFDDLKNFILFRFEHILLSSKIVFFFFKSYFQVNGVDLRDATHEFAVETIKNAQNPVKFVLQSLQSSNQHVNLFSNEEND